MSLLIVALILAVLNLLLFPGDPWAIAVAVVVLVGAPLLWVWAERDNGR